MNGYFTYFLFLISILFASCNNEKPNSKQKIERNSLIDEIDSLFYLLHYNTDTAISFLNDTELFYLKKSLLTKIEGASNSSIEKIYYSEDDLFSKENVTYYKLLVIDAFNPQGEFFQLFEKDSNFFLIYKKFVDTVIIDRTVYKINSSKIDTLNFHIEKEMFWDLTAKEASVTSHHHCENWIFEVRNGVKYGKIKTCYGKYNFMLYLNKIVKETSGSKKIESN